MNPEKVAEEMKLLATITGEALNSSYEVLEYLHAMYCDEFGYDACGYAVRMKDAEYIYSLIK